jgi:hypothetical protein
MTGGLSTTRWSVAKSISEKTKVHGATVIPRMSARFAPCRAAAFLALAAIACLVLAACSPGADYPSLFPSVHDIPPPRTDTTLDSNQVQQATEDLINARDHLSAEAQGAQGKKLTSSNSAAQPPASAAGKPSASAAGKPSANATAARKQPTHQISGRQSSGTDTEAAAGTETK